MLTTHLRRFDIFQDQIDVKLEPARGGVIGDVDLVLGIREKGRVFLKAGTEVGGGEGGFVSYFPKGNRVGLTSRHACRM
jgi:outer membrane protein insertion porin family